MRTVFHAVDAHVVVGFTPQSTFSRSGLVRTSDGYQRRALISSLEIFGYQVRRGAHHEGCGSNPAVNDVSSKRPLRSLQPGMTCGGLGMDPVSVQKRHQIAE